MYNLKEAASAFEQFYSNNIIFSDQPYNLYEPCRYTLNSTGKKIRPVLCIMAYQLFHDVITDDVYNTALSFEMFHNFTLIHDDIMDNSEIRRGKPSVYKKFGATAAILSGDVMNICAYDRLGQLTKDHQLVKLLRLFNKTAIEICEGQQLDMDFETIDHVELADYIEMIRLKTSVLLAACLKAGAILADAPEEDQDLLYRFGIELGIAFQIQDDILDTFGTEEIIGKKPGGDIRANKKTALNILLRNAMSEATYNAEFDKINSLDNDNKFLTVKGLYALNNIDSIAKNLVLDYTQKAFNTLNAINVAPERLVELRNLANYLLNRNK